MTAEELTTLLGRHVMTVESRQVAYASSHPLALLDIRLADGTAARLVVKDTGALLPAAHGAKPAFLCDTKREHEVYREVLAGSRVPAPRLVAAAGNLLVLEHVSGSPLSEVGQFRTWEEAARTVGRMHRGLQGRQTPRLVRYDRAFFARWLDRARMFAGADVDALVGAYRDAVERILTLPTTVIHGELYASNVLVTGGRICFLDWETASVGTGLFDLAALTSGSWTAREREALAIAYAAGLGDQAGLSKLLVDLECCRLVLAVHWLGWSRTWSPPIAQRQDWLAEARRAAEMLG